MRWKSSSPKPSWDTQSLRAKRPLWERSSTKLKWIRKRRKWQRQSNNSFNWSCNSWKVTWRLQNRHKWKQTLRHQHWGFRKLIWCQRPTSCRLRSKSKWPRLKRWSWLSRTIKPKLKNLRKAKRISHLKWIKVKRKASSKRKKRKNWRKRCRMSWQKR